METNASHRRKVRRLVKDFMLNSDKDNPWKNEWERYIDILTIDIDDELQWEPSQEICRRQPIVVEKVLTDPQLIAQAMEYITYSEKVCCFTGHRAEKLNYDEDTLYNIKKRLAHAIKQAVIKGYRIFINGGCSGIDIMAGEIVSIIKERAYEYQLFLVTVVPFRAQAQDFSEEWKARYYELKRNSDFVAILSENKHTYCYRNRNALMVKYSDLCVAVSDGTSGGTTQTIRMALEKNSKIYVVPCSKADKPRFHEGGKLLYAGQ